MKFTIQANQLRLILAGAARGCSPLSALGGLHGVLVEAKGGRVAATGSDGELWVQRSVAVEGIEQEGEVLYPLKLIAPLPQGDELVVVEAKSPQMQVLGAQRKFTMSTAPTQGFPAIAKPDNDGVEMLGGAFTGVFSRLSVCVAPESSRYALSAVACHVKGGVITFRATDGRRLAMWSIGIGGECNENELSPALVCPKALGRIASQLDKAKPLRFSWDDSRCWLVADGLLVAVSLVSGRYPALKGFTSAAHSQRTTFRCPVEPFRHAVQDILAVVRDSQDYAHVVLSLHSHGNLSVSADVRSGVEGEIDLLVEASAAKDVSVVLNARWLAEYLAKLPGDSVVDCGIVPSELQLGGQFFVDTDDACSFMILGVVLDTQE